MWYWHDGAGGWAWVWMTVMMAVVWLPLVIFFVWALRAWSRSGAAPPLHLSGRDDVLAAEIARRAYARGEISRERFLEVMADLQSHDEVRAGGPAILTVGAHRYPYPPGGGILR